MVPWHSDRNHSSMSSLKGYTGNVPWSLLLLEMILESLGKETLPPAEPDPTFPSLLQLLIFLHIYLQSSNDYSISATVVLPFRISFQSM